MVKRARQEAERTIVKATKATKKQVARVRRSLKKTFSKKRNQRRAVYAGSAVIIVSLLFGVMVQKVQSHQEKQVLTNSIQEKEQEKVQVIEELQTLSKDLETIKEQKAVTDTQLQEKAAEEARVKAENEKLKADLQAKLEAESRVVATATPSPVFTSVSTGGRGGATSVSRTRTSVNVGGNTYSYGYCTWYVKNRRPDIPNSWGNANAWLGGARSDGFATGYEPRAGAIGQTSAGGLGHVVYVERVNGDGTILVSEMNYQGWGVESSRTTSASEFAYIY